MDSPTRQFVRLLTDHQSRLYAFIFSLVGDMDAANEVLQETNLALWEGSEKAAAAESFTAWAYGVARRKVMVHWQSRRRDRHVFDDALLEMVAPESERFVEATAERAEALHGCIDRLPAVSQKAVAARYESNRSVPEIARSIDRSVTATTQLLYRARLALLECIESAEAREAREARP